MIEPICWMPSRKAGQNIIEIKPRRNYGQEFEEILKLEEEKLKKGEVVGRNLERHQRL